MTMKKSRSICWVSIGVLIGNVNLSIPCSQDHFGKKDERPLPGKIFELDGFVYFFRTDRVEREKKNNRENNSHSELL